jgi:hypothetical protein
MAWFPRRGIDFAMRKALGAMRFQYRLCFGPEEEPGHDSRGRKATASTKSDMILEFRN